MGFQVGKLIFIYSYKVVTLSLYIME